MKKRTTILPVLVFIVMAFSPGCKDNTHAPNDLVSAGIPVDNPDTAAVVFADASKVYVCKSAGAKRYHPDENCRGLKQCTHDIITMTVKEAEGKGLTLCGYED